MTPLGDILIRRIRQTGPLSIADYMTECLTHPQHGYYTGADPLGRAGDFVTAPEVSQMFGELIGLFLAEAWLARGAPAPAVLAELGPGRGTLMADALRAAGGVPGFRAAMALHLVEVSPVLRAAQAAALSEHRPAFHDTPSTLPDGPLFLVANEFLDALPVRQFLRDGAGWSERVVGERDGRLVFGRTAPAPLAALEHRLADTGDGDLVETRPAAEAIVADIAGRIARQGGVALIVDYGSAAPSTGDTFQAVERHRKTDPLARPGRADLTAHVDFDALTRAARAAGAEVHGPLPQGAFLARLGIGARAEALARRGDADAVAAQLDRLTAPAEMGDLFQVLGLARKGDPPPAALVP